MDLTTIKLNAKQHEYIKSTDSMVLYYGAVRTGKSFAAVLKAVMLLLGTETHYLFIALTQKVLEQTLLTLFHQLMPEDAILRHDKFNGTIDIRNAEGTVSKLYYRSVPTKKDYEKLRGMEITHALLDEATDLNKQILDMVISRMNKKHKYFNQITLLTNPTAPSNWVFQSFLNTATKIYNDAKIIHTKLSDQTHLEPDYVKRLYANYPRGSVNYKRFIEGLWTATDSAVFDQFNRSRHVIDPIELNPVVGVIGIDWGAVHDAATLLLAKNDDGRWYLMDGMLEPQFAWPVDGNPKGTQMEAVAKLMDRFKNKYGSWPILIADSACAMCFQAFDEYGFNLIKANKNVMDGIDMINNLFANDKLFIFNTVQNKIIDQIESYEWKKPGVMVNKINDDAPDALRYVIYTYTLMEREANNINIRFL